MSIRVNTDKWIPHYPKNKILYPIHEDDEELLVFDLIDPNLHCWKRDFIMTRFSKEEAEAICRIPLSRKDVSDLVVWLHNRNKMYSVKSRYHVARKVMRTDDWVECSRGLGGQQVWKRLWQLEVPNKIKVFGWRACHNILPTRVNLIRRRIISDNICQCCIRLPQSAIHVIWECSVA